MPGARRNRERVRGLHRHEALTETAVAKQRQVGRWICHHDVVVAAGGRRAVWPGDRQADAVIAASIVEMLQDARLRGKGWRAIPKVPKRIGDHSQGRVCLLYTSPSPRD